MTQPSLKSYNRKLYKLGNQLCRHLELGGSIRDSVGSIIVDKIITLMKGHESLWAECLTQGIDEDIIRTYLQRSIEDLKPDLVLCAPFQPMLLSVYMLVDFIFRVNFVAYGVPQSSDADKSSKREEAVEYLLESARLFRSNNHEFPYRALQIEGQGGLPDSVVKGFGCSPVVVILLIAVLILGVCLWQ